MGIINRLFAQAPPSSTIPCTGGGDFLGLPKWYQYVCDRPLDTPLEFINAVPLIFLGVVDILLRIAGLLAIGYVVYGAVRYVVSQGEPDKTAQAKGTIINALAGLLITTLSIAIITFIGNQIG